MANNPDFVRLADHMVHGLVVDMDGTGWSLSGYDVQPFPEDSQAARFVRQKINAGIIEPASQAEYDEAHPEADDDEDEKEANRMVALVRAAAGRGGAQQEHKVRERENARGTNVQQARAVAKLREAGFEPEDEDADLDTLEYEADLARREALEEESEVTDDPAEQQERTATRAPRKAAGAAKKAPARRGRKAADEESSE